MNQDRVNEAFERVLAVSYDEREAMLQRECGNDQALRKAVTALLGALERAGGFLASPTADSTVPAREPQRGASLAGSSISQYRLLELIGEGGFGAVYMAEQSAPIRRRVAVKVLKPGMDSRSVVGRFEAERQALALMDHPNIAKVLDAGSTAPELGSLPFFVMELVRGVPITQFCDEARLTPRERLEILVPVCLAVQHAHAKGVIHRDLKPSNVLVTLHDGMPVPKVIDFGIAKATGAALTDKTVFTEFRALIGTPAYMSPEQAEMSGLDIDTRSDIYSLGVLMYELLTGSAPFEGTDLARAGLAEMQRIIRDQEPPRPSTRISTAGQGSRAIANHRHTSPDRLAKFVRGELDWIVMRAMEKDRSRRYSTADALAADISRFLDGEPVLAAPPDAFYKVRKFIRRHRGPVVAAVSLVLVLLAGLSGTAWGLVDARHRRQEAEAASARAIDALDETRRARERERAAAAAALGQAQRARIAADLMRWGLAHEAQPPAGSPPPTTTELLIAMTQRTDRQVWASSKEQTYARAALADLLLAAGEFRLAQQQTDRLRVLWEREGLPDAETAMVTAWTAVEVERATLCSNGERYWGPLLREQTLHACAAVDPTLRDTFESVLRPALSVESVPVSEYQERSTRFRSVLLSTRPPDDVVAGMAWTLHACAWGRGSTPYGWPHADAFLGAVEELIAALPERSGLRERLLLVECDVLHLRLARRDPVPWERVAALADAVDRLGEGAWIRGPLECHVGKAIVVAAGRSDPQRTRQGVDRVARGFSRIRESPMPHQRLLQSSIGALFDTEQQTRDASLIDRAFGPMDESVRDTLIRLSSPDLMNDLPQLSELYRRMAAALDAHPVPDPATRRMLATALGMGTTYAILSGGGGTWRDVDQAALLISERVDQLYRDSGDPDWMNSAWAALVGSKIAYAGPDRALEHRFAARVVSLSERIQGPDGPMAIMGRGSEGLWCLHNGQVDEGVRVLRQCTTEAIALGPPDSEVWQCTCPFVVMLAKNERWEDLAQELDRLLPWMANPQGRVGSVQLMRVAQIALFQPSPSRDACDRVITVADRYASIAPGEPHGHLIKGLALAWLGRADEALVALDEASRLLTRQAVSPDDYRPGIIQAGRAVALTLRGDSANAQEAIAAVERTDFETTKRGFVELWHFRERVRERVAQAAAAGN